MSTKSSKKIASQPPKKFPLWLLLRRKSAAGQRCKSTKRKSIWVTCRLDKRSTYRLN